MSLPQRRSYGPAWEQAIAFGIDVTLLESNLALPPWARIRQLDECLRFAHDVARRTLTPEQRRSIEADELASKADALGWSDPF